MTTTTTADDGILFDGVLYPVKEHNGFRFATESLYSKLSPNQDGEFVSTEAASLDETIAFYFEDNALNSRSPEELYREYLKI